MTLLVTFWFVILFVSGTIALQPPLESDDNDNVALVLAEIDEIESELNDGDIRLVGGSTAREGRVEVFYSGAWGTVCDDYFGHNEALVICRQLGLGGGAARLAAFYGQGIDPIWLDELQCTGNELSLASCPHRGWGNLYSCSHAEDAGVICDGEEVVPVRLVDGSTEREGRVEVFYNGEWGTVCDDYFDNADAGVVCRQLGFSSGKVRNSAFYQAGIGRIWLDQLGCSGTEQGLNECPHYGWGKLDSCSHGEDAGVLCDVPSSYEGAAAPVRIVDGSTKREGRVEVLYNGEYGTVCDDDFSNVDARVVCRQLGFSDGQARHAFFTPGLGKIWLDYVSCSGTERGLNECPHQGWGKYRSCSHGEDVGVICDVDLEFESAAAPVRIVDGSTKREGRVEVLYNGEYGTVCDDDFSHVDARVVCRQLGFSDGQARYNAYFTPGLGPIWLDYVTCSGTERGLNECSHQGWGKYRSCSHGEDVGVICDVDLNFENPVTAIRLRDGATYREGRVEILYQDQWGTVCDDDFSNVDAQVVCRQLGFSGGLTRNGAFYGQGIGNIILDYVSCSGFERGLGECPHYGWKKYRSCSHAEDAGVICEDGPVSINGTVPVRLVEGSTDHEGRVEVFYDGEWGTVCDDDFGHVDASIVCHQLGFSGGVARNGAFFTQGIGAIWLDYMGCIGNERGLNECPHYGWGKYRSCTHAEDAGVLCEGDTVVPVRLAGTDNNYSGRVEVFYDDEWGTVCDDDFHAVDAQVVCKQLGFTSGTVCSQSACGFGPGIGRMWLDNVVCLGTEAGINECNHYGWGRYRSCSHSEDAGVTCSF